MDTNAPSRAKSFFDEIKSAISGFEFLSNLANGETPAYELEFIDFKTGYVAVDEKRDELRALWAKCLSCYANSDGGVVIFGINAPQGKADGVALVQDTEKLVRRLKELLPKLTEPPVQRVEIELFSETSDSKAGFVVCLIPPSPWRPHQVRVDGQPGLFYVRASDNCVPCNHSTLRALFAPQLISRFEIHYRCAPASLSPLSDNGRRGIILQTWLWNAGPASAEDVFILLKETPSVPSIKFHHLQWEDSTCAREGQAFITKRPIHPEEMVFLFTATLGEVTAADVYLLEADSFHFQFTISARNQGPAKFAVMVDRDSAKDVSNRRVEQLVWSP